MNGSANTISEDVTQESVHTFNVARVIATALSNKQENNSDNGTDNTLGDEKPEEEDWPSSPSPSE